ncbi:MAG: hydrogenase maturation protease [Anaerolineae bacterium]|jgi:hydrogenase maturation protease|nr:hydrogenase maturation protease [Anaerolineae bacterium]MBT7071872.1 hydrogenase maturation protease [Anaerolineae bacterium]MBT7325554.1 hydrogenase maturation protease [Anaerolineae bacterium]
MKKIIIGIGQKLRGDDAVGPEVVRAWEKQHPESAKRVRVEISQLPGLELLGLFGDADIAILVDAVQSGAEPGTVHITGLDQVISFEAGSGSVHGFGVAETLALGKQVDPDAIPDEVIIIGIESEQIGLGEDISAGVRASIPEAVRKIEAIIQKNRG